MLLEIDGVYGASTAEAVRALQKNMGLEQTGAASTALQELSLIHI